MVDADELGDSVDETRPNIGWRRLSPESVPAPIVRRVPYLELALEHPALEPSGHGDRFFPDAVPYELGDTPRVFYWRDAVAPSADDPETWELACATTRELVGFDSLPADGPPLVTEGAGGTTLVVDGTIAGETTTSQVASYTVPELSVDYVSDSRIGLTVDGAEYSLSVGERRRIRLGEQRVRSGAEDSEPTTVTPVLVCRFPGRRELHHPARDATYRLFPSFGLDLDALPNPLPLPTTAGELDDAALATQLGVDPSQRPYPERVLWQAFACTAFDPHTDATPALTQLETGHVVLLSRTGHTE